MDAPWSSCSNPDLAKVSFTVITRTGPQGPDCPTARRVQFSSRAGVEESLLSGGFLLACRESTCNNRHGGCGYSRLWSYSFCARRALQSFLTHPGSTSSLRRGGQKSSQKPFRSCMFFTDCRRNAVQNLTERKTSVSRLETYPFGHGFCVPLRNLAAFSGVFGLWAKTTAKVTLLYQSALSEKLLNRLLSVQDRQMNP